MVIRHSSQGNNNASNLKYREFLCKTFIEKRLRFYQKTNDFNENFASSLPFRCLFFAFISIPYDFICNKITLLHFVGGCPWRAFVLTSHTASRSVPSPQKNITRQSQSKPRTNKSKICVRYIRHPAQCTRWEHESYQNKTVLLVSLFLFLLTCSLHSFITQTKITEHFKFRARVEDVGRGEGVKRGLMKWWSSERQSGGRGNVLILWSNKITI